MGHYPFMWPLCNFLSRAIYCIFGKEEDWVFYFPAAVAEELILRYFDIPVENLRSSKDYIAKQNNYRIEGWQDGGAYPRLEVWDLQENEDGTLAISVAFISATDEAYGKVNSILTVKPMEDGSFLYIANELLVEDVA